MVLKLMLILLIASISWSSAFCPKDIQAKVKSAIKGELITKGEEIKGYRLFIKKELERTEIEVPLHQSKATWSTIWDEYVELLYMLPEGELPKYRFPVKVLDNGKTYICTVSIYYTFYGLAIEVE